MSINPLDMLLDRLACRQYAAVSSQLTKVGADAELRAKFAKPCAESIARCLRKELAFELGTDAEFKLLPLDDFGPDIFYWVVPSGYKAALNHHISQVAITITPGQSAEIVILAKGDFAFDSYAFLKNFSGKYIR